MENLIFHKKNNIIVIMIIWAGFLFGSYRMLSPNESVITYFPLLLLLVVIPFISAYLVAKLMQMFVSDKTSLFIGMLSLFLLLILMSIEFLK